MLTIPHLEALVAVAELGSFRAASQRLNVTQPTVSRKQYSAEEKIRIVLDGLRGEAQPPVPANEADRVAALRALDILDTGPDEVVNLIVKLATDIFNVPIAAVTLVDHDRQWFKASCGLTNSETPRDESFCAHVVAVPAITIVPDTLIDPRFAENPGVIGSPHLRFYAGHPIVLAGGQCIGTVCIADVRPRSLVENDMGRLAKIASLALQAMMRPQ